MSQPSEKRSSSLSRLAIRNTFWAYLSFIGGKGLTFVTTVILARLLVPAQFGVVGYCLIALQYLDLLNDIGVGQALVARRDKLDEARNAAFAIGLGMSLLMFAVAWIGAPYLAEFFREPQVTDLFRVLSVVIVISAFGIVPGAMMQRELRFKARMIPNLASTFVKGSVSIGMALTGYGVWSLIIGQICGQLVDTVMINFMVRWRPGLTFDRQATREVLSYGVNTTVTGMLGQFMTNVDYLLIGRMLGSAPLGYYTTAYRIPELIIRNTNYTISNVAFPLLSQQQAEISKLKSAYFGYLRYISLFSLPVGFGLAITAPAFIHTIYPPIWEPTIVPMQLISIALSLAPISGLPGVIYKAVNRPDILSKLSIVKVPVVVAVLWYMTRYGIEGVALGHITLTVLSVIVDSLLVSRIIGFRMRDVLSALTPAAVATSAMVLVTSGVATQISLPIASLIILPLVGAAVYVGALALVSRETLLRARTMLRTSLART